MQSPAAKHFQKVTAEKQSKNAVNQVDPNRSAYELLLGKLAQDKKRLKQIKSVDRKIEVKGEIVGEYDDYLDGVIASNSGIEDIVLTTLMLWNIDARNYERAVELAKYAIPHGLTMPSHIERGTLDAFVEEMADQLLKEDPEALQQHREIIEAVFQYTEGSDLMDQVSAKIHKLCGIFYERIDPEKALRHYRRAIELDGKIGLKTIANKLEKSLQKKEESEPKNGLSEEEKAAHAAREALENKANELEIEFEQNIESEKLEALIVEAEKDNEEDSESKTSTGDDSENETTA